jgi:hypothetical protein
MFSASTRILRRYYMTHHDNLLNELNQHREREGHGIGMPRLRVVNNP